MDLLQLRVIERVLAVVIGGLSIYLGYRLFVKLPKQKDSSGKVMLPGDLVPYSRATRTSAPHERQAPVVR